MMKLFYRLVSLLLFILSSCTGSPKLNENENTDLNTLRGSVEISGSKLNWVAEGTGTPCLVIGSSIYYPRTFSKQLRDSLRFYFVDMRWFAKDYNPVRPGDYTLDSIMSDIEKVRTELKLEKFIIAGHSIHSVIAFEYARKHPDKVSHILMIGSPAYQSNSIQEDAINNVWKTASPERQKLMNENWKKLAAMKDLTQAQFEIENYCLMAPKYWYDMNYDAKWLWKDMTINTEILTSLYESVFRDYFIFRNERTVPSPVFAAIGRYDYVDPCTLWEGFEDIKGLTVRIFERSGHTPQLEESELFDRELLDWLRQSNANGRIDRKSVVERHRIITTVLNPKSPAQTGNGEFAFGVDITGLQTFIPFNTLSQWSWHSFPLPPGQHAEDFKGVKLNTHGRQVRYDIANDEQPELSSWLVGNPHRFNLGRVGFLLLKSDGDRAKIEDLKDIRQEVDLWTGVISSYFTLEGKRIEVKTTCHSSSDAIGVSVKSDLISAGRVKILFDFPYPDSETFADYMGDYKKIKEHRSAVGKKGINSAEITRNLDDIKYFINLNWSGDADFLAGDTISSPHRFYLDPGKSGEFSFSFEFSPVKSCKQFLTSEEIFRSGSEGWQQFWNSGAAIDLSQSKDKRWKELERRIVLSQYLMKVNEAGSYPPQESGLVNNGWYGRFHFEMIWWHGVHYALWNRWPLFDRSLHVYKDFLPSSEKRASVQGYKGARWPKCTGNSDNNGPHPIHAMLFWQQPHPIYFAELDYRLHPSIETLEKWKDIVKETADFMADFAFYDKKADRYILGPPVYIVSENTDPAKTCNPCFELSYWRYGLTMAQVWRERMGLERVGKWDDVLKKLSPLPQEDGVFITHEKIDSMWTKYTFEHPALIGIYGMLPGAGVDPAIFARTLEKVMSEWDFNRTWGWDFPMISMAAARSGNRNLAVEMLLIKNKGFEFDEHGLATGGPFPYFPSNGALLSAVAMMAAGWDGSKGYAPGFPDDGSWVVRAEGFNKMP